LKRSTRSSILTGIRDSKLDRPLLYIFPAGGLIGIGVPDGGEMGMSLPDGGDIGIVLIVGADMGMTTSVGAEMIIEPTRCGTPNPPVAAGAAAPTGVACKTPALVEVDGVPVPGADGTRGSPAVALGAAPASVEDACGADRGALVATLVCGSLGVEMLENATICFLFNGK
jgi:hypothetical protein